MNNQFNNYNDPYNDPYNNSNNAQYNYYNDPYNQQYNNMGMQQPYDHQKVPYINNNDNRGGGFFSFLLAVILLVVCGALLLHFTGIYDLSEYLPILNKFDQVEKNKSNTETENNDSKDKEESKEPDKKEEKGDNDDNLTAEEKELKSMCSLVDSSGNYSKDENHICVDDVCAIFVDDLGYTYDCKTNQSGKMELDDIKIEAFLNTACANISTEGSYSNPDAGLTCTDYVCNYTYKGGNYSKVCTLE